MTYICTSMALGGSFSATSTPVGSSVIDDSAFDVETGHGSGAL